VVHGIDLDIRPGECLALVGESGSGKSVTAHSILQLLARTSRGRRQHSLCRQELLGVHERYLRQLRGNRIAMIFQEPMTSLNPLHTIEKQIGEEPGAAQRPGGRAGP
jgi:microcin C transport system ATP-binding protein